MAAPMSFIDDDTFISNNEDESGVKESDVPLRSDSIIHYDFVVSEKEHHAQPKLDRVKGFFKSLSPGSKRRNLQASDTNELDDIVLRSQFELRKVSDRATPTSDLSTTLHNHKINAGYVDAGPEELGAMPMRGKRRHDWKKIQQITFKNWVNDRLSGSRATYTGPFVNDLQRDFKDGLLLIRLLENLTSKKIRGFVRDPTFTAQKISNIEVVFQFMKSEKVKLIGIGELYIITQNSVVSIIKMQKQSC